MTIKCRRCAGTGEEPIQCECWCHVPKYEGDGWCQKCRENEDHPE